METIRETNYAFGQGTIRERTVQSTEGSPTGSRVRFFKFITVQFITDAELGICFKTVFNHLKEID